MSGKRAYIHMISGNVMIECSCGADISHPTEAENGTDEMEYKVECVKCKRKYIVVMSAELKEVKL